jgi:hypothetical protein
LPRHVLAKKSCDHSSWLSFISGFPASNSVHLQVWNFQHFCNGNKNVIYILTWLYYIILSSSFIHTFKEKFKDTEDGRK